MNEISYEEFTNKELNEICETRGIDVDSKNVSKPTKAEFIEAIVAQDARDIADADDFLNVDEPGKDEENGVQETETEEVDNKPKELTRAQKRRQQYERKHALKRVIVNSNSDNQTKTNLIFISWGNRLLGHNTDRVYLGSPWHVRQGALDNLKDAVITESIQNEENNRVDTITKPAYIIQELPALTKDEIDAIARRQTIRDSSIESLI